MCLNLARRIPRFQGLSDTTFTAEASLSQTTVRKAWSRPPISVDFQVLMFTASGLLVRFLKVFEKSNYQSVKVRLWRTNVVPYGGRADRPLNAARSDSGCDVSRPRGDPGDRGKRARTNLRASSCRPVQGERLVPHSRALRSSLPLPAPAYLDSPCILPTDLMPTNPMLCSSSVHSPCCNTTCHGSLCAVGLDRLTRCRYRTTETTRPTRPSSSRTLTPRG